VGPALDNALTPPDVPRDSNAFFRGLCARDGTVAAAIPFGRESSLSSGIHEVDMKSSPSLLRAVGAVALLGVVHVAHADCDPVVAAYAKAAATKHYAVFEVDRFEQAPKGEPFSVTIGDTEYVENYVQKSPISIVKAGYKKDHGDGATREMGMLKTNAAKGQSICNPLGDRRLGTASVTGYRIVDKSLGSLANTMAIEMWIDKSSGLPLWHGVGSDGGGFRWAYGDAAKAPAASEVVN
jgi:hypothetical protein